MVEKREEEQMSQVGLGGSQRREELVDVCEINEEV